MGGAVQPCLGVSGRAGGRAGPQLSHIQGQVGRSSPGPQQPEPGLRSDHDLRQSNCGASLGHGPRFPTLGPASLPSSQPPGAARGLAGPAGLLSAASRGSGLLKEVIPLWGGRLIKNREPHLGAESWAGSPVPEREAKAGPLRVGLLRGESPGRRGSRGERSYGGPSQPLLSRTRPLRPFRPEHSLAPTPIPHPVHVP